MTATAKWTQVSDTRHEFRDGATLLGCIHLTDLGWLQRVWDRSGRVTVLGHRRDELLAKVGVEKAS